MITTTQAGLVSLRYDRGEQEYQAHLDEKSSTAIIRYNGQHTTVRMMLVAIGFLSKSIIDPVTDLPRIAYWRTKSDTVAKALMEVGDLVSVDDETRDLIRRQSEKEVDSRSIDADIEIPSNSEGYIPKPYQRAGVKYITGMWDNATRQAINMNPFLGDEMGLGKSGQVLMSILMAPDVRTVLIVCPSSVKDNWFREIGIWLCTGDPRFCEPSNLHVDGWRIKRNLVTVIRSGMRIIPQTQIWIVNYDLMKNKAVAAAIAARKWDVVVADEAQNVKTPTSARSKTFYALTGKIPRKVAMTGTVVNKVMDAQPIVGWLYPGKFGVSSIFRREYEQAHDGAAKLGRDLRSTIMIARKKIDVAGELPPYMRHIHMLTPDEKTKAIIARQQKYFTGAGIDIAADAERLKAYDKWARQELMAAAGTLVERDVKAKVRRQFEEICLSMEYKNRVPFEAMSAERKAIGLEKIPEAIDFIRDTLEETASLVVFYHHKEVGDALKQAFAGKWAGIDGSTGEKDRDAAVQAFQQGHVPLFLGSIRAANSGINLHRADTLIMVEADWNASENEQAEARIHRTGQRFPCTAYYLVYEGSLDARLMQVNAWKSRIAELVMG